MKTCPSCSIHYPDALEFCPQDGTALPANPRSPTQAMYDRYLGATVDGRYKIEAKLGEGGMGVVYAARHVIIDKRVAIKALKKEAQNEETASQRFIQEARSASKIGHANIVDITDFGVMPDGSAYFVMEFLEGTTLAQLVADGPVAAQRTIRIAAQMARGLQAAHKHGIVHRDLKPDNIFLLERDGESDFVKIVDFGIAKVQQQAGAARLTQVGMVLGTPEYMSPEQATGKETDHRVDEYALGCIMYEMLTADVPFKGTNAAATLTKHVFEQLVPPRRKRPDLDIPEALEEVVLKAMAKKPDDRYPSMVQLLEALDATALAIAAGNAGVRRGARSEISGTQPTRLAEPAEADQPEVARKRKGGLATLAAATGAALLLGVAGWILLGRGAGAHTETAPPATEARPAVTAADRKPSAPPKAAAPASAVFTLQSVPTGASVYLGATRIGATPVAYKHARGTQSLEFSFRMAGYKDVSRVLVPDADHDVEVALVARGGRPAKREHHAHASHAAPSPSAAGHKPGAARQNVSDLRDPFR